MEPFTAKLWAGQNKHDGDRLRLFQAVGRHLDRAGARPDRVLYPGSYVDIAASFVFGMVTYVDVDRRAKRFFEDREGVNELIAVNTEAGEAPTVEFIAEDYRNDLGLSEGSFDLLVSLYAGFVSEACGLYLRVGGHLLVNPSHGDVAMASIDPRFELAAVIDSEGGDYRTETADLGDHLVPRKPQEFTPQDLHQSGRGIAYTRSAFAYLFRRIA